MAPNNRKLVPVQSDDVTVRSRDAAIGTEKAAAIFETPME